MVDDLVIARADVRHLAFRDRRVVERCAPVGSPLEHREVLDLAGDGADDLDTCRAGADDTDSLAAK